MYRNDGTSQRGKCIEMTGTEGVVYNIVRDFFTKTVSLAYFIYQDICMLLPAPHDVLKLKF